MMEHRRILTTVLAVAAFAGACSHRVAPPAVRPALSGHWVLATNGAQADTGALATTGSNLDHPAERTRTGGRGGYGGREREGSSSEARAYDPAAVRAAMDAVRRGDSRINIVEGRDSVHFDFADGSYFDLPTDGKRLDDIWRGVGRIRSSAYWSEAGLVLERKLEEPSITVTQTFARPAGAARLTVTTAVKGPTPRPLTMKREYTVATAPSGSAAQ